MSLLMAEGLVLAMAGRPGQGAVERTIRIWLRMLARVRLQNEARVVAADIHFPKLRFVEVCAVVGSWGMRVCGN